MTKKYVKVTGAIPFFIFESPAAKTAAVFFVFVAIPAY